MFAVARFLLEISQRTYPVASRMMKLSGRSSTIHGADAASGWHAGTIASLPVFTRLQTYRCAALSDAMGHYRKSRPRYITDKTSSLA
jgi:hypothetical protein